MSGELNTERNENRSGQDDSDDEGPASDDEQENIEEISAVSSSPRKSIFKSTRRLSGMPNMLQRDFSPEQNLCDEDLSKLRIALAKFPEPPQKISSLAQTSTYSSLSQSAAKYLKGFWGSSSK
jgi:hypothetical protein